MEQQIYISGIIFAIIYLYFFFGTEVKCGTIPKIILNIRPFIQNSKIYIGNFHLHHWLLGVIIIIICCFFKIINYNNKLLYFLNGFSIILVIHGLFYQDCFDFR